MLLAKEELDILEGLATGISGYAARIRQKSDGCELTLFNNTGEPVTSLQISWWTSVRAVTAPDAMLEYMGLKTVEKKLTEFDNLTMMIYEFAKAHARG